MRERPRELPQVDCAAGPEGAATGAYRSAIGSFSHRRLCASARQLLYHFDGRLPKRRLATGTQMRTCPRPNRGGWHACSKCPQLARCSTVGLIRRNVRGYWRVEGLNRWQIAVEALYFHGSELSCASLRQ